MTSADIPKLVASLREHQPEWEAADVSERVRWLRRYSEWLLDNEYRLMDLLITEVGKPAVEAGLEFIVPIDLTKYYTRNAKRFLAADHPPPHSILGAVKRVSVVHRPYPVVGVITPWNFPLGLSLCDPIPALLAGCAVVVKPAPETPKCVLAAVDGWSEIGAPPIFKAVADGGPEIVDAVDYVQFTGSTDTGRRIAQRCAERLIPYGLELGGKDPAIVLDDADIDSAARGIAWGAMANAGQMCTSVERVYVATPIYDEFVDKLVTYVASLRRGIEVGSLVTENQFDIVSRHIDDAVSAGARIVAGGGRDRATRWIEPTVLVDVDHTMACIREETFGPLIPVMRVTDETTAVALANDTTYGLSATVWSGDTRRAERLAARLEAGAVNVNDCHANAFCLPAPMHGWKESGIDGRFGGRAGILKYTRPQTITSPRVRFPYQRYILWFPYNDRVGRLLRRVMRVVSASGLRRFR